MSVTTTPTTTHTTASATRRPAVRRALGIVTAVSAGLVAWGIGALVGADYWITDSQGTARVDMLATAGSTVVIGLLGWGVLAAGERLWRHGRTAWTVLGWTILVASMAPVFLVEATTPTRIGLALVHLAVGGALLATLPHTRH